MQDLGAIVGTLINRRRLLEPSRSLLIGLSGIDGSGKGFIAARLASALADAAARPAVVNVDARSPARESASLQT